jgi:uptake hydrogenase large subunit
MTDPAGKLQIRIAPDGVTIRSTRPVRAASILVGRGLAETARLVPALYSICSTAQSAACAGALERALGLVADPLVLDLRRRLVDAETLREHLWRILLDWPGFSNELDGSGAGPDSAAMALVMRQHGALRAALAGTGDPFRPGADWTESDWPESDRAGSALAALVAECVLGGPPRDWLAGVQGLAGLADWSSRTATGSALLVRRILDSDHADLGRSAIDPLPDLADSDLDQCLSGPGADAFVARPTWDGTPRETSPLTRNLSSGLIVDLMRHYGNGLLTRLAAQLLELARLAVAVSGSERDCAQTSPPSPRLGAGLGQGPGLGLAQVQAARGLLVHRVRIARDRVTDYRILAPTEWSFHPRGAVAAGLADLAARGAPADLAALARLFVAAVDPCVGFDLELVGESAVPIRNVQS